MSSTHRIGAGGIGFPLRELRGRKDRRLPRTLAHMRSHDPLGGDEFS